MRVTLELAVERSIGARFSASYHHWHPLEPDLFFISHIHNFRHIMSYNREWDRGKQSGVEGSWQYQDSRGSVHPRDDEYYSDGKRRKFNNGVRERSLLV